MRYFEKPLKLAPEINNRSETIKRSIYHSATSCYMTFTSLADAFLTETTTYSSLDSLPPALAYNLIVI